MPFARPEPGRSTHPVDAGLRMDEVAQQAAVYETLARHFHRSGLQVIVRHTFDGMPRRLVDPEMAGG